MGKAGKLSRRWRCVDGVEEVGKGKRDEDRRKGSIAEDGVNLDCGRRRGNGGVYQTLVVEKYCISR